jgi:RNA polymerase sigma-70 factor (ECF subfamily)
MHTLQRAIHRDLSDRQRRAVLGELHGVPSEALAEQLGVSRNAFYKLHHDARKKLKSAILAAGFSAQDVMRALGGE